MLSFVVVPAIFLGGAVVAYEEPPYEVVSKADGYEVRKYSDRVAAQVSNLIRIHFRGKPICCKSQYDHTCRSIREDRNDCTCHTGSAE